MKKYIIIIFCFLSISHSQCEDLSQLQCGNNINCEWLIDIQSGNCSNLDSSSCDANPDCWGAYTNPGWYYGWYCAGGNYEIDNSYCEEIQNPVCTELNYDQCNSSDYGQNCNWVENVEYGNCWVFNEAECNLVNGCEYNCSWIWDSTLWQDVWSCYCEGQYEIDNGFCEDLEFILGDVNQDYIVNVMDIILVVNLILENQLEHLADLNHDYLVNIIDILMILDIILAD